MRAHFEWTDDTFGTFVMMGLLAYAARERLPIPLIAVALLLFCDTVFVYTTKTNAATPRARKSATEGN